MNEVVVRTQVGELRVVHEVQVVEVDGASRIEELHEVARIEVQFATVGEVVYLLHVRLEAGQQLLQPLLTVLVASRRAIDEIDRAFQFDAIE
ncbi:hypothetical protein EVA_01721 [gut metagenome]|uniref:Uncharacterized protein n=1 Tax=gut metagenome TaxID=749906 RepID=J9GPM2_9ZZZZ